MHLELYSQDAEESIIAIILEHNHLLGKIGFLKPEHFYFKQYRDLYSLMLAKLQKVDEIGSVDFVEWSRENFPDDPKWIWKMQQKFTGAVPTARKIKDLANKRDLNTILQDQIAKLNSSEVTASDVIEEINATSADFHTSASHYKLKSFASVCLENVQDMDNETKIYPTGFDKIDRSMNGGLRPGCSYCIAARPKAGKTMIKGTIASNLRKGNDKFLFVAAEMGSKSINKRVLGRDLNRSPKAFESDVENKSFKKSVEFMASNDPGAMYYVDAPRVHIDDLLNIVRKAIYQYGITGFILDYIQLVSGGGDNRVLHLENVAQSIAEICKKENVWCLYSAQINREGLLRGGDGILMAVEWLYELKRIEEEGELLDTAYLEHIATRETEPVDLGSEHRPYLKIAKTGTHMEEM